MTSDQTIQKLLNEINNLRIRTESLEQRVKELEGQDTVNSNRVLLTPDFCLNEIVTFNATAKTPSGRGKIIGITGGKEPFLVLEDTVTKQRIKRKPTSLRKLTTISK